MMSKVEYMYSCEGMGRSMTKRKPGECRRGDVKLSFRCFQLDRLGLHMLLQADPKWLTHRYIPYSHIQLSQHIQLGPKSALLSLNSILFFSLAHFCETECLAPILSSCWQSLFSFCPPFCLCLIFPPLLLTGVPRLMFSPPPCAVFFSSFHLSAPT